MDNALMLFIEDAIADAIKNNKYCVVISSGDEDFMLQFNKEVRQTLQDKGFYVFPAYHNTITIDWKQNPEAAKEFVSAGEMIKAAKARDIAKLSHLQHYFENIILSAAKNGDFTAYTHLYSRESIEIFREVILPQLVENGYVVEFSDNKNDFCEITIGFFKR